MDCLAIHARLTANAVMAEKLDGVVIGLPNSEANKLGM